MSTRAIAAVTIFSILFTAFPAAFFVAQAATLLPSSAGSASNVAEYTSGSIDASAHENLVFSFDYEAESLDGGDIFTPGWRTGSDNDFTPFAGVNEGVTGDETGMFSFPLPVAAQAANLEVYVKVVANTALDVVNLTNVTVSGDLVVVACTPQFDSAASSTNIQNTISGDYFDSINDALADCDTVDGDTIVLLGDITTATETVIDRPITLDGNDHQINTTVSFESTPGVNSIIEILDTTAVTIQGVTIEGAGGTNVHGINIYEATGVQLNDVASNNNDKAALIVNGSEVIINNFHTEGNGWYAINAAPGSGVTAPTVLTINGVSTHGEVLPKAHIYTDDISEDVTVTDTNSQYEVVYEGPNPENIAVTARALRLKEVLPPTATVTMCKYDEFQNPLAGWQLALIGEQVETLSFAPTAATQSMMGIEAGDYVLKAEGAYEYRGTTGLFADARFSERKAGDVDFGTYPDQPWRIASATSGGLAVQTNGDLGVLWGSVFSPAHVYYGSVVQAALGDIDFNMFDDPYNDNVGSIELTLSQGATGVTGTDGCVSFTDVPYGDYVVEELLQADWAPLSGLGPVIVDEETETFVVENRDTTVVPVATIIAEKIVCTDESDLPNWGGASDSTPDITATTAATYVADSNGACWLEEDWEFEWASRGSETRNPDNDLPDNPFYGPAGTVWTTFGPTDSAGLASVTLTEDIVDSSKNVWVREVLQSGYIPFTYGPGNRTNEDDVTAEMYCHTDGRNYDNVERVEDVVAGNTYHCVAFNTEIPAEIEMCEMVSDAHTVIVENNTYATSTYEHSRWTASIPDAEWIWEAYRVIDTEVDTTRTFEETFTVASPTAAVLDIAADNSYRVFVNGVMVVDRSTIDNNYQLHTQKTFTSEVLAELVSGENTLRIEVTNTGVAGSNDRSNPAGLLYKLVVDGASDCEVTTEPEEEVVDPATLVITNPAVDNDIVPRELFDFTAEYNDDDEIVDTIQWAIRAGTCSAGTGTVAGNVDGFTDSSTFATTTFTAALDTSSWAAGNYCFVVNPSEQPGEDDLRATRLFILEDDNGGPAPEPTYLISGSKVEVIAGTTSTPGVEGWIMTATNGTTSTTTLTDSDGEYTFMLPAGSWAISEEVRSLWEQVEVQRNDVVVPNEAGEEICSFTFEEESESSSNLLNFSAVYVSEQNSCDFYNKQVEDETPVVTPTDNGGNGSSNTSGTLVRAPEPETGDEQVLGASTNQLCSYLTDYMQTGVENNPWEVTKLQVFLSIMMGYENPVTGVFGSITDMNVKKFQTRYSDETLKPWFESGVVGNINPTGFVYKTTKWKINDIMCPDMVDFPSLEGEDLLSNVDLD